MNNQMNVAWLKVMQQAKENGFTHYVNVFAKKAGRQRHFFRTIQNANTFYEMAKTRPDYWLGATRPAPLELDGQLQIQLN